MQRNKQGWGMKCIKSINGVIGCIAALWCGSSVAAWSNLGGGDHDGANWAITNGTYIASNHYNIGTVTISSGVTAYVKQYASGQYGWIQISASNITILGTLDASGAGYRGGNGGNGGTGSSYDSSSGTSGSIGVGGEGPYAGAGGGAGLAGYDAGLGANEIKRCGFSGGIGLAGGYAVTNGQGDVSTNEVVWMGSGGGGAGGGGSGWRWLSSSDGGGGGGAGNPGGGSISLMASNVVIVHGAIVAKGWTQRCGNGGTGLNGSPSGAGGTGGNRDAAGQSMGGVGANVPNTYCYAGGPGNVGGAGAGGGVLLKGDLIDLQGGNIDNRGGGDLISNGGTLKMFYVDVIGGIFTNVGRVYLKQYHPPECGTVFEF